MSAGAEALFITQPAITARVQALERARSGGRLTILPAMLRRFRDSHPAV